MNADMPLASELRASPRAPLAAIGTGSEVNRSGVSWAAIFAGAAGAAALSLILLILGMGLGLSSVSPWTAQGFTITTFSVATILWLTITQLVASGMGGYLAGRLRTKWPSIHTDEVYFRDTAHGFMAWAVATLLTAALLTSSISSILGTAAQAGASATAGAATAAIGGVATAGAAAAKDESSSSSSGSSGMGYWVDSLFRRDASAAPASPGPTDGSAAPSAEVARIFATDLRGEALTPEDTKYVGQVVSQRTGLSQADAEKRVTDTFTKVQAKVKDAETAARDAADKARKASSYAALWLFVSLLAGAFVASLAATFGGRRRDL